MVLIDDMHGAHMPASAPASDLEALAAPKKAAIRCGRIEIWFVGWSRRGEHEWIKLKKLAKKFLEFSFFGWLCR